VTHETLFRRHNAARCSAGRLLGLAVFGLALSPADIQAGDPAALSEDVDFVRLRRSLTEQIIAAYLQVTGRAKKLSPFENVVAIGIHKKTETGK
jgi:hypothetical protein